MAHNTPPALVKKNTLQSSSLSQSSGIWPGKSLFLGYGIDLFKARFSVFGAHGFLKRPILRHLSKQFNHYKIGHLNVQLPSNIIFKTLYQYSELAVNGTPFSLARALGKIGYPHLIWGGFQEEIKRARFPNIDEYTAGIFYGIHHFNHIVCTLQLPSYTTQELRMMADKHVLHTIDAFCANPARCPITPLFEEYGAFICVGATYGGYIRLSTALADTRYLTSASLDELAFSLYKKKTGGHVSLKEIQALDFNNYNRCTCFEVVGGRVSYQQNIGKGKQSKREETFNEWLRGIHDGKDMAFVDFTQNGIIPVWHLAKNSYHKALLQKAFQTWYEHKIIEYKLLPSVITEITLLEKDQKLERGDTDGFTHRTGLIGYKNEKYLYLGYNKEPAYNIMKRDGRVIVNIKPKQWHKKRYHKETRICNTHNDQCKEVLLNQFGQSVDLAPEASPLWGTQVELTTAPLSFYTLEQCMQAVSVSSHLGVASVPEYALYQTIDFNIMQSYFGKTHSYACINYLPVVSLE